MLNPVHSSALLRSFEDYQLVTALFESTHNHNMVSLNGKSQCLDVYVTT